MHVYVVISAGRSKMPTACKPDALDESLLIKNPLQNNCISQQTSSNHWLYLYICLNFVVPFSLEIVCSVIHKMELSLLQAIWRIRSCFLH